MPSGVRVEPLPLGRPPVGSSERLSLLPDPNFLRPSRPFGNSQVFPRRAATARIRLDPIQGGFRWHGNGSTSGLQLGNRVVHSRVGVADRDGLEPGEETILKTSLLDRGSDLDPAYTRGDLGGSRVWSPRGHAPARRDGGV
jgi:hypothetical protein